jgi:hypothetical protein
VRWSTGGSDGRCRRWPTTTCTSGLLRRDGSYQELFAVPNRERLLGGTPAPGQDPSALWRSRIHPADLEAFRACDARLRAGVPSQVDYRVHGLDG